MMDRMAEEADVDRDDRTRLQHIRAVRPKEGALRLHEAEAMHKRADDITRPIMLRKDLCTDGIERLAALAGFQSIPGLAEDLTDDVQNVLLRLGVLAADRQRRPHSR